MTGKQLISQPLSMISTILEIASSSLAASKEQLGYMEMAKEKPHMLDDAIISRSLKLYKEQNENSTHYLRQCKIWKQEQLNKLQLMQVEEVEDCTNKLIEVTNKLLAIFSYCQDHTINKILGKDDMEFALDFLSGKIKLP